MLERREYVRLDLRGLHSFDWDVNLIGYIPFQRKVELRPNIQTISAESCELFVNAELNNLFELKDIVFLVFKFVSESRSSLVISGSICAIRKELFHNLPRHLYVIKFNKPQHKLLGLLRNIESFETHP